MIGQRVKKMPDTPAVVGEWVSVGPGSRKRTLTYPGGLVIEEVDRRCPDCGQPWPEPFVVHDELWKLHGTGKGIICLRCIEARMGRQLSVVDLKRCPLNEVLLRMGGEELPEPIRSWPEWPMTRNEATD